jgi:hypothetical protein
VSAAELQALFEAGRACFKSHQQHLQDIGDSPADSADDAAAAAQQQPGSAAGPSSAAASGSRQQQGQQTQLVVEAMLQGNTGPLSLLQGQVGCRG